ncbi:MAG: helix-turn-helix transcriptional regulator [Thiohalospira sp.]
MYLENRLSFEETKDAMASKLFTLDKKRRQGIISITEVGDFFPVGVVINSRNGENLYMNAMSEQILGYTAEETRELGKNYAKAIQYDEKEAREILNEIDDFFHCQDDSAILAQFQRLRPKHKKDYEWMYIASKLLCEKPDQPASKRLLIAAPVSHMGNMNCKIKRVLEENLYMKKNFKRFAALTKREKEVLSLVAVGKESKEISEMLFISRYTVEQHRKNIARKIEHRNFTELIQFAMAFDLI